MSASEAVLAEFNALRAEIGWRSGFQHNLFALNLTAVATFAGIVLANRSSILLLLLIPFTSSSLGLLWADHARNISTIGYYIRTRLSKDASELAGSPVLKWESFRPPYKRVVTLIFGFRLSILLGFSGPPLIALMTLLFPTVGSGARSQGLVPRSLSSSSVAVRLHPIEYGMPR